MRSLVAALATAVLLLLGTAAQAGATTRYAVADGYATDANCLSANAQCSLRHVLQDVILTADEVVVMPGTYDLGSSGVVVRSGSNSVNIHGADGQPRPRIVANTGGVVFNLCLDSCPADLSTIRHLHIENTGTGSALFVYGGAIGTPVTIDDVEAVAGSGGPSLAILASARTGIDTEATIRNTVAFAPGANSSGAAIASDLNLTMRNVTAIAPASGGIALSQAPMCSLAVGCSAPASSQVFNSILDGGPGGADIRTTAAVGCGACFGNVALDYSNYDAVTNCVGCSLTAAGSAHNQVAAPLLSGGGDAHQQPGSPTIDGGIDSVENGSTDLDGNARTLGAAPDIGAYEDGHPRPVTDAAANVTETGATLRGSVDPLGFATTYYFDWGTTTAYGNRVPATALSAGSTAGAQAVSQELGGLTPGATVHYRLVAENSFGAAAAADQSFTTLVAPGAGPGPVAAPSPVSAPAEVSRFAGVQLTARSLVVQRGHYVLLPIRCPSTVTGDCAGKVTLTATGSREIVLGAARFSLHRGTTKAVKLTLSTRGRGLVKAKRSVKALARLSATAGGQTATATQKVTVRAGRR